MTLTLIRKVEKEELLENIKYTENEDLKAIYGQIDYAQLTDDQKDEFQRFVVNILKHNNKVVNDYYLYENELEENIYVKLRNIEDEYQDIRELKVYLYGKEYGVPTNTNLTKYLFEYLEKLDIKGIRENTPPLKLINMYLRYKGWDNSAISQILDKLQYKVKRKYIINVSNTGYSQLTSTYTYNYSSCYDLYEGGYRASNVFLMGDNNNYIVKVFKHNDDNLKYIEDDTLKVKRSVISRFNFYYDRINDTDYIIANKVYGSYEFTTDDDFRPLLKDILKSSLNVENIELFNNYTDCNNYLENTIYCSYFEGYRDYESNCKYRNMQDRSLYSPLTIGKTDFITWDIDNEEMIMIYGQKYCCACCGYEAYYEEDLYYCEDTDDCRCSDCCWWCEYDSCYYSNETDWVETPDGCKYRQESCYYSN
jgi:hypothetical protein